MFKHSFPILLIFALAASFGMASATAQTRIKPYEVEIAVAEQSAAERQRASTQALLITLSRVTGLASIPRTPGIVSALADPAKLYSQFAFAADDATGQFKLRVTFEPRLILDLIEGEGLPVWWSRRPSVVAWVALDHGEPRLLSLSDGHRLTGIMLQRALFRGIPLEFPLMDLDDSILVDESDVLDKAAITLDVASKRYAADLILTGRLKESFSIEHGSVFAGDWEAWVDGEPLVSEFRDLTVTEVAYSGIDMIADRLFDKYAVLSRGMMDHELAVAGLDGAVSYAALMDYLASLEFVDDVAVEGVTPQAIHLKVASRASFEQLMMLLEHDGMLGVDRFYRGLGSQLVWLQGSTTGG
jgi:hypothetical protein